MSNAPIVHRTCFHRRRKLETAVFCRKLKFRRLQTIINEISSPAMTNVGSKRIPSRTQLVLSTGLQAFDSIIGGGIPVGSIFLLEEDECGKYANVIMKHYISEGIIVGHSLALASLDASTKKLVTQLPALASNTLEERRSQNNNNNDKNEMKIAWRYEELPKMNSAPAKSLFFGNIYDMSIRMSGDTFENAKLKHWEPSEDQFDYEDLLEFVRKAVKGGKYGPQYGENCPILRIALHSLGSPCWVGDICDFMYKLRCLLHDTYVSCFITISSVILDNIPLIKRIEHASETAVKLECLGKRGSEVYSEYDGLLRVLKLPNVNALKSHIPESNDWAFKLKKTRFLIEKLHISPDFVEKESREEEDVSSEYIPCGLQSRKLSF